MIIFFTIVVGLIVGSFLNVVIHRLYSGGSILWGHSQCPHCKEDIKPYDLIPVVSFILLRGKCRHCHKPISWQYPIVELVTAITFALLVSTSPLAPQPSTLFFQLLFAASFIVIAVFDLKHYLILDKVILPLTILAIGWNIAQDIIHHSFGLHGLLMPGLLAGVGLVIFFGGQYLVSGGRWIGLGDVKLGFLLGNVLGWPLSLMMLMLAYFSGAFIGVGLIAAGQKQMSSKLPFGTFLGFSAIITMLYGEKIVTWYLKLIGF